MQGVLSFGLREYYQEVSDPRIPEAVVDSARYVIGEMWKDDAEGWTYTSCPGMKPSPRRAPVMAPLVLFAWELSRDPAFLDIAVRSMNQGFDHLGSMVHLRWTPYIVSVLEDGDGKVDDAGIMIETERTPSCGRGLND